MGCYEHGDEPSSSINYGEFFKLPLELSASAEALRSVQLVSTDRCVEMKVDEAEK